MTFTLLLTYRMKQRPGEIRGAFSLAKPLAKRWKKGVQTYFLPLPEQAIISTKSIEKARKCCKTNISGIF